jgi:hypothetical protein
MRLTVTSDSGESTWQTPPCRKGLPRRLKPDGAIRHRFIFPTLLGIKAHAVLWDRAPSFSPCRTGGALTTDAGDRTSLAGAWTIAVGHRDVTGTIKPVRCLPLAGSALDLRGLCGEGRYDGWGVSRPRYVSTLRNGTCNNKRRSRLR